MQMINKMSGKDMFKQSTLMLKSSPQWNELTQSIFYFIAKDMQPIHTVNDKGFRTMINKFEPLYIPPNRKTLSTKYLPQMFEKEKESVGNLLGSVKYHSCTPNLWTPRAKHAYISLTVHYFATDFSLQNQMLEIKDFLNSHTGLNIMEEFEAGLQQWGLSLD